MEVLQHVAVETEIRFNQVSCFNFVHESLFQKPEQALVEDHMKPIFERKKRSYEANFVGINIK
jgi:hypothetical protein